MDVAAFGVAFLLGATAYLGIRFWLGKTAQVPVTTTLIVIMVSYAVVVTKVPRLRVRLDQAGDNSYYLGLLFTLGSMGFALYDFGTAVEDTRSASGVRQIISNFGIALATTIIGIFLRVMLHQMRVDPADLEAVTRVELTEAAERLRATLDTVTTDLSRFHIEMQQRSSDVMTELTATVKKAAADIAHHTTDSAVKVTTAAESGYQQILTTTRDLTESLGRVALEAAGAMERFKAVDPPSQTLSRRLDKVAAVLEQVAIESERTTQALRATSGATSNVVEAVGKTSEVLDTLASRMSNEHVELTERVGNAANGLVEALGPFNSRLQQIVGHAAQLEEQLGRSNGESLRAQHAATEVLNHLTVLAKGITDVLRSAAQVPHARS